MSDVQRMSAGEARRHIEQGALLVCAYDDAAKCNKLALRGALNLEDLAAQHPLLHDREILFYCA